MHGFGRVVREDHEPVFHSPWEGRVYGITRQMRRFVRIDPGGFRYAIEQIDPPTYLSSSYYEKWLRAIERLLIDGGVVTATELEQKTALYADTPDAPVPRRDDPARVTEVMERTYAADRLHREGDRQPRFSVGDRVKARNINTPGHTRLPGYIRGKEGEVVIYHGVHDVEDSVPVGTQAEPRPVYAVRFDGAEVWGESRETNYSIFVDMWENYLEPVEGEE